MAYNVTTKTNLTYFKKKEATVARRFSDFLGENNPLCSQAGGNIFFILPRPPPSRAWGGWANMKIWFAGGKNDYLLRKTQIKRGRGGETVKGDSFTELFLQGSGSSFIPDPLLVIIANLRILQGYVIS